LDWELDQENGFVRENNPVDGSPNRNGTIVMNTKTQLPKKKKMDGKDGWIP
jgi:hypothetical protein